VLYERKLIKEVINKYDFELSAIEEKASVYGEAANYLLNNNCTKAAELLNKLKQEMDEFTVTLKQDLLRIEDICNEISITINKLQSENQDIPSDIIINNQQMYISNLGNDYSFIYPIGLDDYKKLYKYGIIKADIDEGEFNKKESKIAFSSEKNLEKYADFKSYLEGLISNFNNCKNIEELDLLKKNINNELASLFYADDLRIYLINNSELVSELTGISGIDMAQKLHENYEINRVRIKLSLNRYSPEDNKIIELIRARLACISLSEEIDKLDEIEDKEVVDMYAKIIIDKNSEMEALMKDLNMSLTELEIAISKVND